MTTWTVTDRNGYTHTIEADEAFAWNDGRLELLAADKPTALFAPGAWISCIATEGAAPPPSPPGAHPEA